MPWFLVFVCCFLSHNMWFGGALLLLAWCFPYSKLCTERVIDADLLVVYHFLSGQLGAVAGLFNLMSFFEAVRNGSTGSYLVNYSSSVEWRIGFIWLVLHSFPIFAVLWDRAQLYVRSRIDL